jgi:hypothetical protein
VIAPTFTVIDPTGNPVLVVPAARYEIAQSAFKQAERHYRAQFEQARKTASRWQTRFYLLLLIAVLLIAGCGLTRCMDVLAMAPRIEVRP